MTTSVIQLNLEGVHFLVGSLNTRGFLDIKRPETKHRIMKLLFYESTHLQDPRANRLKIELVLSGRVFVWHGGLRGINRNDR
jgi:hypothetical protein